MYDDVIGAPSNDLLRNNDSGIPTQIDRIEGSETNGGYHQSNNNMSINHVARRHQLYVGNLSWVSSMYNYYESVHSFNRFILHKYLLLFFIVDN